MKLISFAKELKAKYVPSYAYPRIQPSEVWDYFKLGSLTTERSIKGKSEMLILDTKAQKGIWDRLCKLQKFHSMNVCISSEINDYMAHEVAGLLNLQLLRLNPELRWKWITPSWTQEKIDIMCQVVFIRSVLPISDKLYAIRDLFDKNPNAVKVLIIGGIHGVTFFDEFLKMPIHSALHISKVSSSIPSPTYLPKKSKEEFFHIPHLAELPNDVI